MLHFNGTLQTKTESGNRKDFYLHFKCSLVDQDISYIHGRMTGNQRRGGFWVTLLRQQTCSWWWSRSLWPCLRVTGTRWSLWAARLISLYTHAWKKNRQKSTNTYYIFRKVHRKNKNDTREVFLRYEKLKHDTVCPACVDICPLCWWLKCKKLI